MGGLTTITSILDFEETLLGLAVDKVGLPTSERSAGFVGQSHYGVEWSGSRGGSGVWEGWSLEVW